MPTFSRNATVDWKGSLLEGSGEAKAGTGAFSLPVSFPRRIGDPQGGTSPEELVAGAHAVCYAMVVNAAIGKKGGSIERTSVTCTVTADKSDAGIRITTSKLEVSVQGLKGLEPAAFDAFAKEAEKGCPVSNALRGNVNIVVEGHAT
jgi:osmotically inducible protein OsmC